MLRDRASMSSGESGFTVLELMVVVAIMGIVLAIAGDALFSLTNTTNRHSATVDAEQAASTAIAQTAADIRSAHTIQFPSSTPNPSSQLILNLNNPSGGTMTQVEWVYQASSKTFTREILNPSNGTVLSSRIVATNVTNGATPALSYFNYHGDNITAADPGTVANCATRIQLQLLIVPSTPGAASITETADAALTDQLALLSQPGNGQC